MPNQVVGVSDREDGKSKKRKLLRKPESEPVLNRTSGIAIFGCSVSGLSRQMGSDDWTET